MGWDALDYLGERYYPKQNFAQRLTEKYSRDEAQLKSLGFAYDWGEIKTAVKITTNGSNGYFVSFTKKVW